jgi:DNA-directed RNA polymerase subunit RPC12/RpoP
MPMPDKKSGLYFVNLAILWQTIWQTLFPKEEEEWYFSCPKCDKEILETKMIDLIDKKPHNFQCPHCKHVFFVEEIPNPSSQKLVKLSR